MKTGMVLLLAVISGLFNFPKNALLDIGEIAACFFASFFCFAFGIVHIRNLAPSRGIGMVLIGLILLLGGCGFIVLGLNVVFY